MRKNAAELGALPAVRLLPAAHVRSQLTARQAALSPVMAHILEEVQRELGFQRSIVPSSGASLSGVSSSVELLPQDIEALVRSASERLGFHLSDFERDEILAVIEREHKPFGILQPLIDNPEISDIIVTGYQRVCVQQARKNFATDVTFPTPEAYEAFVERLLQRADATYSTKKPIADGMIGSFARVHAVHKSVCDGGPYLTIRLNRFAQVTLEDLLSGGLAPQPVLAYLRGLIRGGLTILIVGEVGTGKTTLARALAGTIPHHESILVIEDTPEIRLEHPHVRYVSTREANTDGAGRVSPSECIRAGMRMAMNRIIFGEMRDAEAAEAFIDVCASGHPGLSTIHARSSIEAVVRLELFLGRAQRGVERRVLSEQIATAVQAIVHVGICPVSGQRRITDVLEIGPVADGMLRQRQMFHYDPTEGRLAWRVVNRVSAHRDILESSEDPVILAALESSVLLAGGDAQSSQRQMGATRSWGD